MIERRLRKLWDHLQAKKLHTPHFLSAVRLQGIRGIDDLRVTFDYPVSVIAGGNASGKSTVLFAAACAYRGAGCGRPGLRAVHAVPRLPSRTARRRRGSRESRGRTAARPRRPLFGAGRRARTGGRARRGGHGIRLFDARRLDRHALAALDGLEQELPRAPGCRAAGAGGLSADARPRQPAGRRARRARQAAPERRPPGDAVDLVAGRVRATDAPFPVFGGGRSLQRRQETAVRRAGGRRSLFGAAHGGRRARHPASVAGDRARRRRAGADRRRGGGAASSNS